MDSGTVCTTATRSPRDFFLACLKSSADVEMQDLASRIRLDGSVPQVP
jgi:hypothetical protein